MANRVWLILFTMVLVLRLNRRSCVMGWALLPVHYPFNIENALSDDALDVHCSSNTKEFPLHGNYVHRFKTGLVTTVSYGCTLTIPRDRAFKVVQVFTDAQKFVESSLMHRSSSMNNVGEDTAFGRCKMKAFTCIRSIAASPSRCIPGIMSRQRGYHSCRRFFYGSNAEGLLLT